LLTDSTDEMSLSCSGAGPELGYTESERMAICGSGDRAIEMADEVGPAATLVTNRECVQNTTRPSAEEVML
jgi:hypothetical protein